MKNNLIIFADGSSLGNPGPGGWGAVVVYENSSKVVELGGGDKHTTNNRMELTGAIEALNFSNTIKDDDQKLILHTDSSYVINGITKWIHNWEKKNWIGTNKKEILNKDLWVKLSKIVKGKKIEWKHVKGHVGIAGNERADFLATMCAKEQSWKKEKFFTGPISKYPYDILNTKVSVTKSVSREKTKSKKKSSSAKAYSYLSLVNGKLMRHATWAECEKRVKGVPKTKFKKAFSKEDEISIAKEWGVK
ncbi:MAG: ribonuclease HI [Candidatus Paceibacterota bacterium]|jgi:ribonuclease HI